VGRSKWTAKVVVAATWRIGVNRSLSARLRRLMATGRSRHSDSGRSAEETAMELTTVPIDKPTDVNFILGQSHFIKTIEDLHEAIVQTVPQMKFGIAFCESSGPALVRRTETTRNSSSSRKRTPGR